MLRSRAPSFTPSCRDHGSREQKCKHKQAFCSLGTAGDFSTYLFLKLAGIIEVGFFGEGMTEVCFIVINPHSQN